MTTIEIIDDEGWFAFRRRSRRMGTKRGTFGIVFTDGDFMREVPMDIDKLIKLLKTFKKDGKTISRIDEGIR